MVLVLTYGVIMDKRNLFDRFMSATQTHTQVIYKDGVTKEIHPSFSPAKGNTELGNKCMYITNLGSALGAKLLAVAQVLFSEPLDIDGDIYTLRESEYEGQKTNKSFSIYCLEKASVAAEFDLDALLNEVALLQEAEIM
jgi:hypothetical protein